MKFSTENYWDPQGKTHLLPVLAVHFQSTSRRSGGILTIGWFGAMFDIGVSWRKSHLSPYRLHAFWYGLTVRPWKAIQPSIDNTLRNYAELLIFTELGFVTFLLVILFVLFS